MYLIIGVLALAFLNSFVSPDAQGDALFSLRTSLNASSSQLTDWNQNQVNPCTWSKVICDSSNNVTTISLSNMGFTGTLSPRIGILSMLNTLQLQGNYITGSIPEEYGNLTSLTMLDLENNHLTGEIPSSLGNLKKLTYLILSQNNLSGSIPESLSSLPNLNFLQLASNNLSGNVPEHLFQISKYNFTGNNLNCGINYAHRCVSDNGGDAIIQYGFKNKDKTQVLSSNLTSTPFEPPTNCGVWPTTDNKCGPSKSKIGMTVGILSALLVILLLGGCLLFFMWKGRHKGYKREVFVDVAGEVDRRIEFGQLKRFSWRELQLATDSFSEKNALGQGGFGKVYKGILSDNTKIAFKRLTDFESPGGDTAFQREVEMISVAVHKNLLRLIGFCTTKTERLLVYPFMQNLSVASRLRDRRMRAEATSYGCLMKGLFYVQPPRVDLYLSGDEALLNYVQPLLVNLYLSGDNALIKKDS